MGKKHHLSARQKRLIAENVDARFKRYAEKRQRFGRRSVNPGELFDFGSGINRGFDTSNRF